MRVMVLIAIVLGVGSVAGAATPTVERIEQARTEALDESYQPQLPRYEDGEAGSGSAVRRRDPRRMGPDERGEGPRRYDTRELEQRGEGSAVVSMLMWGIIIVLAVVLAVWLASELARADGEAEAPEDDRAEAAIRAEVDKILERPLGDAEELARRGEFAEAIHTLLLRTLQELVRRAAVRVAPAMTSREILARVPLLADARDALAGLITAVEITHFGDEPANAADFERCRRQFQVFADALRSNAGAAR
ncbi:MAG: DUF4129 domain-containing protein [Deltaproteobacteria bacterium]|nr:DUF4129 domain-containing protein [Deltaproteobacteria bacterium]